MATKNQIILGIDPGFGRVGFGVIKKNQKGDWVAIDFGCINTTVKKHFQERLMEIDFAISTIIKKYQPDVMGIEKLYFSKNVTTGIEVAHARGVIMLAGAKSNLEIFEFTPPQIKQAITGFGKAEKSQMQKMVAIILGINGKIKSDDAADALAVALCTGQSLWHKKVNK